MHRLKPSGIAWRWRAWSKWTASLLVAMCASLTAATVARAEERRAENAEDPSRNDWRIDVGNHGERTVTFGTGPTYSWREAWVGAEATGSAWALYGGLTVSPFGYLREDGWRLRSVSGYGRYHYDTHVWTGTAAVPQRVGGTLSFADVLLGYHRQFGALTIKAFAGGTIEGHQLSPDDEHAVIAGVAYGAKVVVESWLNITDRTWTSLDLSWASTHDARNGRLRLGHRLWPSLSLGAEASYAADVASESGRAGIFLRNEWASGELSGAVGVGGDRAGVTSPYGTLNWLIRY